ncbi:MAG: multicopper oxidase domain-containing protein [Lentilitoribacter sp.]
MISQKIKASSKQVITRRSALKFFATLASTTTLNTFPSFASDETTEEVKIHKFKLDVQSVNGRPAYNGLTPGPTIAVNPGEVIDVDFTNSLPALHDDCTQNPNNFHGINTTNLHTHGLHVSPNKDTSGEYDADNVFVSVVPENQLVSCSDVCGESVASTFRRKNTKYRFELGDDHPSGTYWYHAHKHGSTAQQVGAGLSGPIIVADKPGVMPEYIEQAEEKILMFMNQGIVLADPNGGGEVDPVINMRPGEVQRWRIINAMGNTTQFGFLRTDQPDLEMYQIAFDGFTLNKRVPIDLDNLNEPWLNHAALASGNRMDLIVRAPIEPADKPFAQSIFNRFSDITNGANLAQMFDLSITVSGDPVESSWSEDDALPGCGLTPFGGEQLSKRQINFAGRNFIDNGVYDGEIKQTMKLGTEEEWHITNQSAILHVFHIHVNPFFITHINGEELPNGDPRRRWQDTIGLPTGSGTTQGSVTYKTRFETFKGKFVIHCHVLRHEDLGMMQVVEVV